MRPPMQPPQPPRFIAAAPAAAALLLFNVPSLWLLVHIQQWVDLFDSRLPERQPRCSAKRIFSFLEGTVSSSGISLFKPSGKPRNSNRRHKKTAQIRPTRSNFHFLVGTFQKHSSFLSSRGAFAWRTVGSVLFDELVFALEQRKPVPILCVFHPEENRSWSTTGRCNNSRLIYHGSLWAGRWSCRESRRSWFCTDLSRVRSHFILPL